MAEFNLEGLLGNAFGGGSGNFLDEYLTEDQRRMMQRNAMLAASAALLKAGGESTRRIGIGEALGGAFEAGQAGYEKAQTGALTQMALKTKMDEAKRAKELNAALAGIMGASTTGEMELPQETANKLMQAGRAAVQAGDFTRGFEFYKQARDVNPKDEVQGGLTQLTDEAGNPIMVQQFKSGKIQTAPGYGPPREMVLQDVGGVMLAIDKARTQTGSLFTLGMNPYQQFQSNLELEKLGMSRTELDAKLKNDAQRLSISERELALAVKRFGLSEAEFARGNYQVEQAEGGNFVYVSKVPGMPSIPVPGTGGKQLSVGMTPIQQADLAIQLRRIGLSEAEFDQKVKQDALRMGISQQELGIALKRLDLSMAEFARGNYEVKEAENGTFMYVSKVPGMPAIPVLGAGGNPLTVGISPAEQARLNISLQQLGLSKQEFDQKVKQDALRMGIDQQNLGLALKRYNLSAADFARGNYKVQETETGFSYIPTVPGLPTIPITGGGGEPLKGKGGALTESQSNAFGFAQRMERVNGILGPLEAAGSYPGVGSAMAGALPFVGGFTQRTVQGADVQRYQQAANDWIRAKLRKESGAAIGVDEAKQEYATYFPMPNDSAAVIEQKRQARVLATEAMKTSAGKTYTSPAPVLPGAGGSGLTWDPAQKKFVNR